MEALNQEHEQLKGVGGNRREQEYVSRAKKIVNASAEELDEYAESLAIALTQYRTSIRGLFNNLKSTIDFGTDIMPDETRKENSAALSELLGTMEASLSNVTTFQMAVARIPALTRKFQGARNRAASVLGELIADITFSIAEGKAVRNLLASGATGEALPEASK